MVYQQSVATPKGAVYQQLGLRIRKLRTEARMTQEELGHATSLTRTSITNIEKGRQPVQVHLLLQIADVLGTRASILLAPLERDPAGPEVELPQGLDRSKAEWALRVLGEGSRGE